MVAEEKIREALSVFITVKDERDTLYQRISDLEKLVKKLNSDKNEDHGYYMARIASIEEALSEAADVANQQMCMCGIDYGTESDEYTSWQDRKEKWQKVLEDTE